MLLDLKELNGSFPEIPPWEGNLGKLNAKNGKRDGLSVGAGGLNDR
jgi:hypothetical protein